MCMLGNFRISTVFTDMNIVEIDPLGGFLAVSEDGKLSLNH